MREIGRQAAEHLLERGFRHFGFCGFRDETWSDLRREGFLDVLQRRSLTFDTYASPWRDIRLHSWEQEHDAIARWLRRLPRPLAVMACNDVRAQHVLDAARHLGAAVPEEIAVIGVDDDHPLCDLRDPPLSSVVPNAQRIGYEAATLLERLMAGDTPVAREVLIEPLGVTTRQSTDILAIDDPQIAAAVRFIREHACEGLKIAQLLAHSTISRPVLERRFRKFLNRSPQAEIRRVQLARARQLLVVTTSCTSSGASATSRRTTPRPSPPASALAGRRPQRASTSAGGKATVRAPTSSRPSPWRLTLCSAWRNATGWRRCSPFASSTSRCRCEGEYHNTVGRIDQVLWPYLEADLSAGRLDEVEAFDLLEEFFLTFNRDSDLYPGVQQGDNGQSVVLGGPAEGRDSTCLPDVPAGKQGAEAHRPQNQPTGELEDTARGVPARHRA